MKGKYVMTLVISDAFCTYKYEIPHDGKTSIRAVYLAAADKLGAEPADGKFVENQPLAAANAQMREALDRIAMFQGVDSYGHVAIARQALKEGV